MTKVLHIHYTGKVREVRGLEVVEVVRRGVIDDGGPRDGGGAGEPDRPARVEVRERIPEELKAPEELGGALDLLRKG